MAFLRETAEEENKLGQSCAKLRIVDLIIEVDKFGVE